jgi:sterol 3beta-glucosyltransferase
VRLVIAFFRQKQLFIKILPSKIMTMTADIIPKKELKNILILTAGSRGDIQPFLAVGIALKDAGYNVRFHTNHGHCEMVESFGIACFASGASAENAIKNSPTLQEASRTGNMFHLVAGLSEIGKMDQSLMEFQRIIQDIKDFQPDLVLKGNLRRFWALYAVFELNLPVMHFNLFPLIHNPDRCLVGLPTLPFGLHKYILINLIVGGSYKSLKRANDLLGLDIMQKHAKAMYMEMETNPNLPLIVLSSPICAPILFPKATDKVRFVGTTVISKEAQLNAKAIGFGGEGGSSNNVTKRIDEFLQEGDRGCIYMGWGSMISKSPHYMVEFAVRALHKSQQRAIVLGGYAGLSLDTLRDAQPGVEQSLIDYARDNILFLQECPHEYVMPRVLATVHHGGAGTTTAALRSGRPTIITPVFFDQWDHAYLVNQLGVGIGFEKQQLQNITYQELGSAIAEAVSNADMAKRAKELGEKLRAEDGAQEATREVTRFWDDYVVTGKFQSLYRGIVGDAEEEVKDLAKARARTTTLVAGAILVGVTAYALAIRGRVR